MARLRRIVAPGLPHHVTQRGNRRQVTFFTERDYALYIDFMAGSCARYRTEIWAYCLMPNHVHLIAAPSDERALARAIGEAHRRYTAEINRREDWTGYLWQGRFASFPMDQSYLLACARYVERNPIRAGLARRPEEYPWSSAAAHLHARDDRLVRVGPLLEIVPEWATLLDSEDAEREEEIRRASRTGRHPLGHEPFLSHLERAHSQTLRPARRGRPPNKWGSEG
ncbi:MAG: transposase [Candidatus Latescibacterota bacterium]|nr:MAG: transposase [Candidatus Latescibacterota bacterium]